jgi:hypothetical protein
LPAWASPKTSFAVSSVIRQGPHRLTAFDSPRRLLDQLCVGLAAAVRQRTDFDVHFELFPFV